MYIGLVVYDGLDQTTGGFLYDRTVVEYLREQGHTVEVISIPWRTYRSHLRDNFDPTLTERMVSPGFDVLLQDELCHPSLLRHNHQVSDDLPIVSIVHHLRSSEPHPRWQQVGYELIERQYLRSVDALIYNSEATRESVERRIGPTESIVAPPAGDRFDSSADPAALTERARSEGPLRVLFVGAITPRKGLATLVTGLSELPRGSWQLSVVGDTTTDPDYVDHVTQLIADNGLTETVTLYGRLSDADLESKFTRSHLLAVPSTYEGFGIVYLEGMAFGLPAVVTTAGGATEIVTDGETGFVVPPNDPDAIAETVGTLIDDRDRLATMSHAAYNRFQSHNTWAETGAQIEVFLESFC